ncbi:MAG: ATP-dependent Clp protease proteolytic subunit [Candidatus Methylacidiphilales bacterium]|nr:ATP-dependent Clp protease proteolytic subunit [Candidatus Methylacidiphilales bacterium]
MFAEDDDHQESEKETKQGPTPIGAKLEEQLYKNRIVTLFGEINMRVAREFTAKMIALSYDSGEPIKVFLNSPGGHVESGDTIHDVIKFVKPEVKIIGTGWVASAGALIYAAAQKKNRFALPNTRFMLHQPMGGVMGQASDISIEAEEVLRMRDRLNKIFADATGQPIEKVAKDSDRNFWMSGQDAVAYGLVGRVISSINDI